MHRLEGIESLQLHVDTVHLGHFATVADKAGVTHSQTTHLHPCVHLCVCALLCWTKNKNYVVSSSIVFAQGEDSMKQTIQRRTAIQQAHICQTCIQLKRKSYQDRVEGSSDVQRHLRAAHLHHLSQVEKQK